MQKSKASIAVHRNRGLAVFKNVVLKFSSCKSLLRKNEDGLFLIGFRLDSAIVREYRGQSMSYCVGIDELAKEFR